MKISLDSEVARVAEFMVRNLKARDLRRVALAIGQIAELVWTDEYLDQPERLRSFRLEASSVHPLASQSNANGLD
jgi:hypothetical protein